MRPHCLFPIKVIFRSDNFVGILLALVAFGVYVRTLAPAVNFIDSGELAAVATTLGVAHPTGYPLFTLLGWVFAHLPLGLRTIYQLNLMSAVLCSVAVFFFFKFFLLLVAQETKLFPRKQEERPSGFSQILAAASGSLILAFSQTFWSQAVSIEVYSLHILFLSLTMYFFTNAIVEKVHGGEGLTAWYVFALMLGLSFANHMTTILLAPGFLYFYFATHGFARDARLKILKATVLFLIGFSVYLYLPLCASQEPTLNWGNPTNLERFWWHFTGQQYRVWIFSSFESAEKQLRYFLETFPVEFAYLPMIAGLIGVVYLFRQSKQVFLYTGILFLGCVIYSINYDIHDIDSYFLLAYCVTGAWIAIGLYVVFQRIANTFSVAALAFVLAAMPLYVHFASVDESKNYVVEDYTMNMFKSLDSNALIISYQWDYFVSASYYYQLVEGIRPDVAVIDKELLRRSWYFKQLDHQFPWLIQNSKAEVDAFLGELHKFEHNVPYNPRVIQGRFEAMILSFLVRNAETRPVYVTHEIEPEFLRGVQKVPAGLAFRVWSDSVIHEIKPMGFVFRDIAKRNKYADQIEWFYANAYTNQAIYAGVQGDRQTAIDFLRKALVIRPDHPQASAWLGEFQGQ